MSRFLPVLTLALLAAVAVAKDPPPPLKTEPKPTPPAATVIAATVNGEKITELAVFRVLQRENPKNREAARKEIVNYLIDNLLIDQYLRQLKIAVTDKDVDDRVEQIKAEAVKSGSDLKKQLDELFITEPELRKEIAAALRWDKFVIQQGTDKVLRDLFDKNPVMFNGTQVAARHILIAAKDLPADKAKARLGEIKKQVQAEVAGALSKLPPGTEKLVIEKTRIEATEQAFGAAAGKESSCSSKDKGGDLGFFSRVGDMVEPFSAAAFSLKAHEMSEPVQTDFGCHLIMTTEWKMGREVKFEEVKNFVSEVYGERLREAVINAYKPRSKVEIAAGG